MALKEHALSSVYRRTRVARCKQRSERCVARRAGTALFARLPFYATHLYRDELNDRSL